MGLVAREVGERGALCARERNTGTVIEEGAVLDAAVKCVGVGGQGNARVGEVETASDVVLESEVVDVVSVVVVTCGADVGVCRFCA